MTFNHSFLPVYYWNVYREIQIDGLVQEKRNSSALAMELCLSSTNPSKYTFFIWLTMNVTVNKIMKSAVWKSKLENMDAFTDLQMSHVYVEYMQKLELFKNQQVRKILWCYLYYGMKVIVCSRLVQQSWGLTHWPLGNFQIDFNDWWLRHLLWNCPDMNVIGLPWWWVSISSGNVLVPSGNKPLPEPMLTQISVAIWHHQATIS